MIDPEDRQRWEALYEDLGLPAEEFSARQEPAARVPEGRAEPAPSPPVREPEPEPAVPAPSPAPAAREEAPAPQAGEVPEKRRRRRPARPAEAAPEGEEAAPEAPVEPAVEGEADSSALRGKRPRRRRSRAAAQEVAGSDLPQAEAEAIPEREELAAPVEKSVEVREAGPVVFAEVVEVIVPAREPGVLTPPAFEDPADEFSGLPVEEREQADSWEGEEEPGGGEEDLLEAEHAEGTPSEGSRRRRRRRRGRRPEGERESRPALAEEEVLEEEDEDDEVVSDEAPVEEEDEAEDLTLDLSTWNVPTWAELIAGLYRPER